ncbi:hypothetical protein D3C78_1256640 [compost metagenome]
MLSNNASPPRPAQRWMSNSAVCSNSRKARFCAWTLCSQSPSACSGRGLAMTGKVLMNRPICASTPTRSAGRPATVAPNATLALPV